MGISLLFAQDRRYNIQGIGKGKQKAAEEVVELGQKSTGNGGNPTFPLKMNLQFFASKSGSSSNGVSGKNAKRQTSDQKALRDLAKEAEQSAKKGQPISEEAAKILDDWADEYNVPQHHKAYSGSGTHFKGGNYSDPMSVT